MYLNMSGYFLDDSGFGDQSFDSTGSFCDNAMWIDSNTNLCMPGDEPYDPAAWSTKPYTKWSTDDFLNFSFSQASANNCNYEEMKLEYLSTMPVSNFFNMSQDQISAACDSVEHGQILYNGKEHYLRQQHPDGVTAQNGIELQQEQAFQVFNEHQRPRSSSESSSFSQQPRRKRGRPPLKNRNPKNKSEKRMGKLWEFLRGLLFDKATCPDLIKWIDRREGVFMFVRGDEVARIWGNRKNNVSMNYEKFSRAMRYYYKSGVLESVPGKRLAYKFGPQATGWKTEVSLNVQSYN